MRAETGSMQFGDDWPGVWIRGDDALFYGLVVGTACDEFERRYNATSALNNLKKLLESCNAHSGVEPTRMKEYWLCARGPCASCKHLMRDFNFTWAAACSKIDGPRWGERVGSEDGCEKWEELA